MVVAIVVALVAERYDARDVLRRVVAARVMAALSNEVVDIE
jgi:hypothetical protein